MTQCLWCKDSIGNKKQPFCDALCATDWKNQRVAEEGFFIEHPHRIADLWKAENARFPKGRPPVGKGKIVLDWWVR